MNLLILDDDQFIRDGVATFLKGRYRVVPAATFEEAVLLLDREDIEGAIIDINLEDKDHNGIEFLQLYKEKNPDCPAIIESGYSDVETVVKCMKLGADDYIQKPLDTDSLQLRVDRMFENAKKQRVFKRAFEKSQDQHQIIGKHESILNAKKVVERAAGLRILFSGETGVGKTPFARYASNTFSNVTGQIRPFEQLNCASLSAENFQDQLFGHKKGAFTSAISDKRGLVELAKGGDLFLDEIGEMPLETQVLFLTFLDSFEYYRLGDDQKRKADIRILCATNKNLKNKTEDGTFRKDLYSRLSQVEVSIPPLRERLSDIPVLFEHFLNEFLGHIKPYDGNIVKLFQEYRWEEGNIRELRDAVEFLCVSSRNAPKIELEHLSESYRPLSKSRTVPSRPVASSSDLIDVFEHGLEEYLSRVEMDLLEKCVSQNGRGIDTLAKKLRVSKPTLYRRFHKYGLQLQ